MINKTIKKIKKSECIFFLFEGKIYEEKLRNKYYMIDNLYIETDSFDIKIDKKLINQSKVKLQKVVVSSTRKELEND